MKRWFAVIALLCLAGPAAAEEKELGVSLELSYHSKWLSKGARGYGSKGALFKTVDLDFWGSGFGAKVTHRNATSSGYVDKQRFDYRPYYKGSLLEGERLETAYNISVGYEHYPGLARNRANTTYEWIFAASWPKALEGGLTPWYKAHYEYPAGSNYDHSDITGWVHRFGLNYQINNTSLPTPVKLSSEVAYTDGLGGDSVDHDWSYATFGAATSLEIAKQLSFTPGIYYQVSMDDSVNEHDELYTILTMRYTF